MSDTTNVPADQKSWWTSKTLWTNFVIFVITAVAGIFGGIGGFDLSDPVTAASITSGALAAINFLLRLVTKKELV